eukprot:454532-Pleurochrysis_carterae.AAC.1
MHLKVKVVADADVADGDVCCDNPTKGLDEIEWDILILYDVEFTATDRLNAPSKVSIIEALRKQSEAAYNKLPFAWRESWGYNASSKKNFRTR